MPPSSSECADYSVCDAQFLADVIDGLSRSQKALQCKYFYDEIGSKLFDQICELDEYYLTRTERKIMIDHSDDMAEQIGTEVMLVEFGSGSSVKTKVLLDSLHNPIAYVPLDISEDHLIKTAGELRQAYPHIEILPLVADFTKPFELPAASRPISHAAVFFPGSTIGNFLPEEAAQMLTTIANILGREGGLLIGIDLQKDPTVIEAAYNDSRGVTDAFNLNVLHRVNRELHGNFNVDQFKHKAFYNAEKGRVEIYIESLCDQSVDVAGHTFEFVAGEQIFTEYSHKYTVDGFVELAAKSGFALHKHWTDENDLFAVLHLVNEQE